MAWSLLQSVVDSWKNVIPFGLGIHSYTFQAVSSTLTHNALLLLSSPLLKGYLGSHIFHKEPRAWNSLTFVWCLELQSTFHLYARIWPLKPPGGWKERSHYPLYIKGSHAGLPGVIHRYLALLVFEYWFVLALACPTHPTWWAICPSSPHFLSFFFERQVAQPVWFLFQGLL